MKKLFCLLMVMAMLASLTACGLFTTPTNTDPSTTAAPKPTGTDPSATQSTPPAQPDTGIQMTDTYTFQDPEGLDFDTRYVLYCDENSASVAASKDKGMLAMYGIYYGKDDQPVVSYDVIICDTAENAKAIADLYASMGQKMEATEDPCVLYATTPGETLEANIMVFQSNGMIADTKLSTYLNFYATMIGAQLQN